MAITILVTGFGPFPGAPFNPTGPLVQRLARLRRPALADTKIVPHIFPTSYAAVDRDLPKLIARHKPDALLMFGLAPRAKTLRIETRARNTARCCPTRAAPRAPAKSRQAVRRRAHCPRQWRSFLPPPAPLACRSSVRTTPGVIFAIICAGGQPRPLAGKRVRISPLSSMCRRSAVRLGPARDKPDLSAADLARLGAQLIKVIAAAAR